MISVLCHPHRCNGFQGHVLSNAIHLCLKDLGYSVELVNKVTEKRDLIIAMTPLSLHLGVKSYGPVVVFNSNEVYLSRKHGQKWRSELIRRGMDESELLGVIDYTPLDEQYFKNRGIRWVQGYVGYHPSFEIGWLGEDFDVGFLGSITSGSRREELLLRLREEFNVAAYRWSGKNAPLDQRKLMDIRGTLNSKVWLHIHRSPSGRDFADIRIVQLGLSNKRFVISEDGKWLPPGGIQSGVHWVECGYDDIVDAVRLYLWSDVERQRIAQAGYDWVKAKHCLYDCWKETMREVESWIK